MHEAGGMENKVGIESLEESSNVAYKVLKVSTSGCLANHKYYINETMC